MYATYTTKAIVCGSSDSRSSDRVFWLFTEAAGMLTATARSVREERSRQRHALQDFSLVRVSLVRGRSGWRIGSVEALGNHFLASRDRAARSRVTDLIKLLRRYLHGETALAAVFRDAELALTQTPDLAEESPLVTIFQLRLLTQLGYIAPPAKLKSLLSSARLTDALAAWRPEMASPTNHLIEQAETASHL